MRQTQDIMGMPITVEVVADDASDDITRVFDYFYAVDERFSTYKPSSEISKINRREIDERRYSAEMREVLRLSEETKKQTRGYFNIITPDGVYDPSGLVKGWAIHKAAQMLDRAGRKNFYIEAGGDIEVRGLNEKGQPRRVGIRNPLNKSQIVKVLSLTNKGVATSGTYERGEHIYNPTDPSAKITGIASITVISPNIYEADRFATAAFAMGTAGIEFIERLPDCEGYMIDSQGIATMTSGFQEYVQS